MEFIPFHCCFQNSKLSLCVRKWWWDWEAHKCEAFVCWSHWHGSHTALRGRASGPGLRGVGGLFHTPVYSPPRNPVFSPRQAGCFRPPTAPFSRFWAVALLCLLPVVRPIKEGLFWEMGHNSHKNLHKAPRCVFRLCFFISFPNPQETLRHWFLNDPP